MYPYSYAPGPEVAQMAALSGSPGFDPNGELAAMIRQDRQMRMQSAAYREAMMHHMARRAADERVLAQVLGGASSGRGGPEDYLSLLGSDPGISQAAQRSVIPTLLLAQMIGDDPDQTRARAADVLAQLTGVSRGPFWAPTTAM